MLDSEGGGMASMPLTWQERCESRAHMKQVKGTCGMRITTHGRRQPQRTLLTCLSTAVLGESLTFAAVSSSHLTPPQTNAAIEEPVMGATHQIQ